MSTTTLANPSAHKLVVTCPSCRAKYRIAAALSGKRAQCSKCQTQMRIPAVSASIITASQATGTLANRGDKTVKGTRATGLGLILTAIGGIIALSAIVAMAIVMRVDPFRFDPLLRVLLAGVGLGGLLSFGGLLRCSCVPRASGARRWIVTAIAFAFVNSAAIGYVMFCGWLDTMPVVSAGTLQLTFAASAAVSFIAYVLFVRKTASWSRRPELAATAKGILWVQAVILSVVVGLVALALTVEPTDTTMKLLQLMNNGALVAGAINSVILIVLQLKLGMHLRRL